MRLPDIRQMGRMRVEEAETCKQMRGTRARLGLLMILVADLD